MSKKEELLNLLTEAENLVRGLDFSADDVVKLYAKLNENLMQENLNLKTYLFNVLSMYCNEGMLENLFCEVNLPEDKIKFIKLIRDKFGFTLPQSAEIWRIYTGEE
jgi:hypothetical protein